jgi:putative ABC transport system permease protein
MRSVLVVFQFAVSIILVTGTFAIHRQMNYILTKKLGFDKDQVVIVEGTHTLPNIVSFKEELLRLASVKNVSITDFIPIDGAKRNGGPAWTDGIPREEGAGTQFWSVDHDYVKTLGLKLLKGRDFRPELASDSQAMVINESLAKALHMSDPLGKPLYNLWKGKFTIIGVVEDFHFESLKKNITPLALTLSKNSDAVLVKVNTADMSTVIDEVTMVWKKFSPHQPIRFTFLDQGYARMYDDVKRTETIFTAFALLAVLVACLGLFALSAFMIEQRGKEIGIRLVLGASLKSIFSLLTSSFIRMVLIAFVIAAPIAFVLLQEWLNDFAYKITLGWELFASAGLLSVVIALVTIGYQSIRAALADPVRNLRSE